MIRIKYYLFFAVFFAMVACNQEKKAKRLPLESFFQNPAKVSFLISPDGKNISFLQPYKNRLNIYVRGINDTSAVRITQETDRNISNYFWTSNNDLFYMKDKTGDDGVRMFAVNKNTLAVKDLLPNGKFKVKILNSNKVQDNSLLVSLNMRDSSVFDVYKLDISNSKLTLAIKNPGNITEWYADDYGIVRLALASDGVNETLLFRSSDKENFKPVVTNNFKTTVKPIGFSGKFKTRIFALSNQNRDKKALVEFNCETGKESRLVFMHQNADVVEAGYASRSNKLTYAVCETSKKQRFYLDDSSKVIYQDIEQKLPNSEIRIVSRDTSERKFIIRAYSDVASGTYYLYSLDNRQLTKLSEINPSLPQSELCTMQPIDFKSRDGLIINGYLTLPKGYGGKKLPVVVIPHGGPASRNSWGFNSEVQFLANRGYAVFQVNFRGSTGYGKKFWIAGFKKWGIMQNDITDGVKWLMESGVADPKRIAIYGSSFGGYSALSGLCFHPELYRCGASYSGITNIFSFIRGVPPYYKPYLQMYYEMVGNPETDADYFRANSPIFHTDKIKAPVLIAQGAKDPRVSVNETNQFVHEIKKRGVPITYILKENEGHYFNRQENREEFYRKLEKFLADNLNKK